MKLSILICTLPETYSINMLQRLRNVLDPQIARHPEVEIRIHDAGRAMSTGAKRNELIRNSDSDYFAFIDCDDLVPVYYVEEMIKAIDQNPDVVTFIGYMTTNEKNRANFTIKLGSDYAERGGHYYRWPNHLCAFKREVVKNIHFQDIWVQEDFFWSKAIRDRGVLKSEVHIQKDMYHYDFRSNKARNGPSKIR